MKQYLLTKNILLLLKVQFITFMILPLSTLIDCWHHKLINSSFPITPLSPGYCYEFGKEKDYVFLSSRLSQHSLPCANILFPMHSLFNVLCQPSYVFPYCHNNVKSSAHMIFECNFACNLWNWFSNIYNIHFPINNINACWKVLDMDSSQAKVVIIFCVVHNINVV